jgi:hypothetical protein
MQGEMSATVFYFPGSYVKLLPPLRQRLTSGGVPSSNIKLGVSTNFDKLCGCVLQVLTTSSFIVAFPAFPEHQLFPAGKGAVCIRHISPQIS